MTSAEQGHSKATAEYAAASAAYESALMSRDEVAIAAADKRLTEADRSYSETLATLVQEQFIKDETKVYKAEAVEQVRRVIRSYSPLNHGWDETSKHNLVMSILGSLSYVTDDLKAGS